MKILHICLSDYGGAGKAALRLHLGLKLLGMESKMLVRYRHSSDNDVVQIGQHDTIFEKIKNKVCNRLILSKVNKHKNNRVKGLEMFSDDRAVYDISRHSLVQESDIIHLHWIAQMINYEKFFKDIGNKPIVWTLHDMNPFTGGCHYAGDCAKYKDMCCECPQLKTTGLNDLSKNIWMRKKMSYAGKKICIVTPSKWLADCAGNSFLFRGLNIDVIPNGISPDLFTKRNRQSSRELFKLPKDKILILFGSERNNSFRKGAEYLKKALMLLRGKVDSANVSLVIFGNSPRFYFKDAWPSVYSLGVIRDESLLSSCYSAADVSVIPSLEDNFPNTVIESMACGTPVIAFNTGGIPDIVKHEETGLLARTKNIEELAGHIKWMIEHPEECGQMGARAQRAIEQGYTNKIQAERYKKIYCQIFN